MKYKKMLDAEEVKEMLSDYGIESAISVIEELQGYPIFECTIRDRIYGNYKNEELRKRREGKSRTYAVIKVRAKDKTDARRKVREAVERKPIRYWEEPFGTRYVNADWLTGAGSPYEIVVEEIENKCQ